MDHLSKEEFLALIDKYNEGRARPEEEEFLKAYFNLFEINDEFTEGLDAEAQIKLKAQLKRKIDQKIEQQEFRPAKLKATSRHLWTRLAAASVILLFSFGLYFFSFKKEEQQLPAAMEQDRLPGGDKAVLILSNGQKINIDQVSKAEMARRAGIKIIKNPDGSLVCNVEKQAKGKIFSNSIYTVQTPNGGKYQVNLPDGTQVWLNAASSLKFPAHFEGKERKVELVGEGYFEVMKDKSKPFRVLTRNQVVEVLGTHFNINGYTDEKEVKTTLLEGAVELYSTKGKPVLKLKPGQQAVNVNGNIDLNPDPDLDGVMAWKNDTFQFEDADLGTVMRQVSRWYDTDIEFRGNIAEQHYRGHMSRNVPLSQLLEILKVSGVNFKIEGRKIIITP